MLGAFKPSLRKQPDVTVGFRESERNSSPFGGDVEDQFFDGIFTDLFHITQT